MLFVYFLPSNLNKSTLLNQIIANIVSNNEKLFLYSGEMPAQKIKNWMYCTMASYDDLTCYEDEFGNFIQKTTEDFVQKADKFLKHKLYLFNNMHKIHSQNIRDIVFYLNNEKGVNCFIFDNLMTLVAGEVGFDYMQQQKQVVTTLNKIAKDFNVVIILVAHPNKESSKNIAHSMFDVAGVSEIVNLADYVFKLVREENYTFLHVLKNRITGISDVYLRLSFDVARRRFFTIDGDELNKKYI